MKLAPRERKGLGYAFDKRPCILCGTRFPPKSPQHKYCCHRCAFIAIKLRLPAAKRMTHDEAIAYYGGKYDDPTGFRTKS